MHVNILGGNISCKDRGKLTLPLNRVMQSYIIRDSNRIAATRRAVQRDGRQLQSRIRATAPDRGMRVMYTDTI
jgi:hypothetical protein